MLILGISSLSNIYIGSSLLKSGEAWKIIQILIIIIYSYFLVIKDLYYYNLILCPRRFVRVVKELDYYTLVAIPNGQSLV